MTAKFWTKIVKESKRAKIMLTRGAHESNLKEGDKVMLQKPKSNKLSPSFETTPYEVVSKQGSHVEMKSPAGVHYK